MEYFLPIFFLGIDFFFNSVLIDESENLAAKDWALGETDFQTIYCLLSLLTLCLCDA